MKTYMMTLALFVTAVGLAAGWDVGGYDPADVLDAQGHCLERLPMPRVIKTLPLDVTALDLNPRRREVVAKYIHGIAHISARKQNITDRFPLSEGGTELVVDPRTGRIFMVAESLWVLEADGTVVASHAPGWGFHYRYLALDAQLGQVYAVRGEGRPSGGDAGWLDFVSTDTGDIVSSLYISGNSLRPTVDPVSRNVWIYDSDDSWVSVIDPFTHDYATFFGGDPAIGPPGLVREQGIVMIPRARRAYALANDFSDDIGVGVVRVFDTEQLVELPSISLAGLGYGSWRLQRVAPNQRNARLYITLAKVNGLTDPTVVVVDTTNGTFTEIDLPYRYSLKHIAVDAKRRRVLLTAFSSTVGNQVLVLDATAGAEQYLGEVPIAADIRLVSEFDPRTGIFFIATQGDLAVVGYPRLVEHGARENRQARSIDSSGKTARFCCRGEVEDGE